MTSEMDVLAPHEIASIWALVPHFLPPPGHISEASIREAFVAAYKVYTLGTAMLEEGVVTAVRADGTLVLKLTPNGHLITQAIPGTNE